MAVYDIAKPASRGRWLYAVDGGGVHRIWYTGGRWAYVSALLDGYTDYIFMTIDMGDPTKPMEAGRYWLPGMHTAGGEAPSWEPTRRMGLHHAIINGDTAYGAWRDAGLVMMDVTDRSKLELIVHKNWSPPFGGGTHNCLPLPDRELLVVLDEAVLDHQEDGVKHIWMMDIRVPEESDQHLDVPAADPKPTMSAKVGHFGPHNLHENRPEGLVSSELIFTTYQNAGIRVFDIKDAFRPEETAVFVPPEPNRLVDHRPNRNKVIQSCDIFVDRNGIVFSNDYNGGLFILEYDG